MHAESGIKLGVGIIGLGVGEKHIEGFGRHQATELRLICDFDPPKLKEVSRRHPGIPTTCDADEVLDNPDIDIVSIASFDNYHFEQAKRAILKGKHVFVEKPLCLYENEAVCLRSLLDDRPHLKLSSNLILRMSPRFRKIKDMVSKGDFGGLTYVEGAYDYGRVAKLTSGWRGKIDFYSIVYGGGVHMIDLMSWVSGDKIEEVFAYGGKSVTEGTSFKFNDLVAAVMKLSSGAIGRMTANFSCVHPHFHELAVYGERATFINRPDDGILYLKNGDALIEDKVCEPYRESHKGDLIRSFIDSILGIGEAVVSCDDVFDVMSVCFAIEKSSSSGLPVKVSYI